MGNKSAKPKNEDSDKARVKNLEQENKKLSAEVSKLKDQVAALGGKPRLQTSTTSSTSDTGQYTKPVQLGVYKGPGDFHDVDKQIIQKLQELSQQEKVNLVILDSQTSSRDIMLLFCLNVSRIGADINTAWKSVAQKAKGEPVVLVVLHHCAPHIRISKTSDVLSPMETDKFQFVLDISFERGCLHSCQANTDSLQELTRIITKSTSSQR